MILRQNKVTKTPKVSWVSEVRVSFAHDKGESYISFLRPPLWFRLTRRLIGILRHTWQNCPYKSSVLYRGRNPTLYHSFPNKENQETMVVVMSNGSACNLCFVSNTSLSDILSFNTFWQTVGSWRTKIDKILNCLLEVTLRRPRLSRTLLYYTLF